MLNSHKKQLIKELSLKAIKIKLYIYKPSQLLATLYQRTPQT
jgi:hypothetical protein